MSQMPHASLRVVVLGFCLGLASMASAAEHVPEWPLDPGYPLDHIERVIPATGRMRCPKIAKVRYRGDTIRYHSPVFVNAHFRERLRRFERVVKQVAVQVYGRAPRRIRHMGTYNCRRITAWPTFLSEHGLANGIDVAGFDFGPASRKQRAAAPRGLRLGFKVRLARHWTATKGVGARHSRFLRTLARTLIARQDVFRVLLGPSYPGHRNHFHFDCAPWRLVDVFGT